MRRLVLLPMVFLLMACGQPAAHAGPATSVALSGTAFVLSDQGVLPVSLAAGTVAHPLPTGLLSPDSTRLYSVSGALQVMDAQTGATLGGYQLPARLAAAGLSHNGRFLVAQSAPAQPNRTSFWVQNLASGEGKTVALDGRFDFDGIADDGSGLFLLQWLPNQPGRYSVREVDLRTGELLPYTLTDKTENQSSMNGSRVVGLTEPSGHWQYTLYAGGPTGAFVHALQLMSSFSIAWCIELPKSDPVTAMGWSIAMTPAGDTIYAANPVLGKLVTIHPRGDDKPSIDRVTELPVASTVHLPGVQAAEAKEIGGGLAVLDGTRLYASGMDAVQVYDLDGHHLDAWARGSFSHSLVLSPDRHHLLAIDDSRQLIAIDTGTGKVSVVASALGNPIAIAGVR